MPRYDYECSVCERLEEMIFSVAEKPDEIECVACGGTMRSVISAVQVLGGNHPVWEPYWDHNLDVEPIMVKSREHRRQLMKERGLEDGRPVDRKKLHEKVQDLKASESWKTRLKEKEHGERKST